MKISVITVCFNSEKTILDSLNSVINQKGVELEQIFIDGKSSDSTIDLIKPFLNDTVILISEKDYGIYDAMNKGIQTASGDVIGLLNSDDVYYNESVLENVSEIFRTNPQIDIVYGDLVYVAQNNLNKIVRKWISKPYYERFFEHANVPPHPSVFLRKSVYEKMGLFDLNFKLAADYEFLLRIFKNNLFQSLYVSDVFVKMRLGGATNKNFNNILLGNKEIYNAWSKNGLKLPWYFFLLKIVKRFSQYF
jgi:glycosyltransferase involved in cell wall biosynthesis